MQKLVYGDVQVNFGNDAKKGTMSVVLWVDVVASTLVHAELALSYPTTSDPLDLSDDEL